METYEVFFKMTGSIQVDAEDSNEAHLQAKAILENLDHVEIGHLAISKQNTERISE